MTTQPKPTIFAELAFFKPLYLVLLFIMGLTGFGQMPIFKRYYIADIPGLGWLADFYATHTIHYIGASALLMLFIYATAVYFGLMKARYRLTPAAHVRIALLASLVITGIFRVFKNLPDISFSPLFTMVIDIAHLVFMMGLMLFGVSFMVLKKQWLVQRVH